MAAFCASECCEERLCRRGRETTRRSASRVWMREWAERVRHQGKKIGHSGSKGEVGGEGGDVGEGGCGGGGGMMRAVT
jgi:hypothetical protein